MSGKKNNRQRQRRQQAAREARARALAQRQRQEKKKRTALVVGVLGIAAVLLLAIALNTGGDKSADVSTTSSTTTGSSEPTEPPAEASAKGKPCVPAKTPLPAGAPNVPVKEGPPPTKLVIEDIKAGTGAEVPKGASVTVNYIGVSCSSGTVFDHSYGKQPATFPLSGVIQGWQDGIPGMKVGGQRLLGIPPEQAYGPSGRPPDILGDETLWFVIDLLEVKPG